MRVFAPNALPLHPVELKARQRLQLAEHALRKRMVMGSIPRGLLQRSIWRRGRGLAARARLATQRGQMRSHGNGHSEDVGPKPP